MNSRNDPNLQLPFQPSSTTISTINHLEFKNDNSLKLFYFNARSLNDKLTELEFLLDEAGSRIDALLISETWSRAETEQSMSLSNYQCHFASRSTRRGGGAAIFIHNSLHCEMIYSYCDEHTSIIAVEVGDRDKTVLVAVYRPPETLNTTLDSFMQLLDNFLTARGNHTTIITGDFNLDLLTTTSAVQRYTNIVLSNGFFFCGNRPTRYEACLDHVLTNTNELLITVQQLQYNLFDHDAMFIEIDRPIERSPKTTTYYRKVDTSKFREFLLNNPTHTNELFAVEDNYNSLLSQLRPGLDAATSLVKVRNKRSHSRLWVDQELKQCIRTKNYWYGKYRQNVNNEVVRNTYTYWANRVTNMKRSKMKQHYGTSFARQQNNTTGTWLVIKDVLGNHVHTRKPLSSQQSSPKSKRRYIGEANNYFASAGKNLAEKIPYSALQPLNPQTNHQFTITPVSRAIVLRTITNMAASKSTGYDGCQPDVLKACSDILADSIADVVNSSIRQSQVPTALKISKVVAIPKTLAAKTFNDYRPINIPSVTDKVLQKVVNKQLIDYLEEHTLLSPHQYGFRPKSNTQTALFDVVVDIQTHCDRKEKVSAIFLDLSKAFDTCDKRILLRRLSELGVIGESLQWFASFLDSRQQYVSDDGVDSELQVVGYGVVQGSIVGPTLFNCYVNNLKDLPLRGHLFMYADDIVLVYAATTTEELQADMNEDLVQLRCWMNQHKLTVNILKTKYMLFNEPSRTRCTLSYGGERIERVDSFKYLGVWLDSDLRWETQIVKLNNKLAQVAGVFKKIAPVIPDETKRMLYFSLFHSHLVYGIAVWGTAGSSLISQLQTTQNKAIKNLFGYRRRTATALIHTRHRFLTVGSTYSAVACNHIHRILHGCIHTNTVLARGVDRHRHFTRGRDNLTASRINTTTFGQNSALYKATMLYNALPEDIKELPPAKFKKNLRNKLFEEQF